ncbi:type II toxin-antitoxin system RelE/ParE family toxin [Trueperella pyogenes]|uniref:type II toxin-antitoxin system RelE/ParE family toxin n=1 Tax=Trueperella pyogenes TaxID=1661 RepID=UPI000C1B658D|nr:type II toxin-antitoxin system RelE/ParE family toxin [Trueperella pyogenes]PIN51658.1 type II toxin-antitoxin system RelE/ParE family toxin [Trueperella pyogenes]
MDEYSIRITTQARAHLRTIRDYIAIELESPAAAMSVLELLRNRMSTLVSMPRHVKLIDEQPWHDMGFRRIRVKNYYVYFWVNDDAKEVNIIAVIYARRDQVQQLKELYLRP